MSIRKIYTFPDPVLRKKNQEIQVFDDELKGLAEDMAETMYDAPGIGLAAPQIGKSIRLIVVDISKDRKDQDYMTLVNPKIIDKFGQQIDEEACLSVTELRAKVKRAKKIRVIYQDLTGQEQELEAEDRFAVVLQHEIDHLEGILFIDHLSALKKAMYKKKVKKWLAAK